MATPFRHRDETLTFFVFIQVNEALIHCRVIATKLKNCRVPSSDKKTRFGFKQKIKENYYIYCKHGFDVFLKDLL